MPDYRKFFKYDFSDMEKIMLKIKDNPNTSNLNDLRQELNNFFKDSVCKQVIYTNNSDKMFFGMAVMPVIRDEDVYAIIQEDDPIRVTTYYLELDSKLFNKLELTNKEIIAVLLHEIGHVVNDATPIETVRKNIDLYLVKNHQVIKTSENVHYREILAFGIKDAIRKVSSLFEKKDDEILADEFVVACGYGPELESAFEKIIKQSYNLNKDIDNKFIVLAWVIRLYGDIKLKRIPAIRSLQKANSITASKLEKHELENVTRRLYRIDDSSLLEADIIDTIKAKANNITARLKYKGIRSYEDDLYDYNIRAKATQDEDEALELMHKINTRLNIIDDYVSSENIDSIEKKRWFSLIDRYNKLRSYLANKQLYRNNYRRLQIIGSPDYYE